MLKIVETDLLLPSIMAIRGLKNTNSCAVFVQEAYTSGIFLITQVFQWVILDIA